MPAESVGPTCARCGIFIDKGEARCLRCTARLQPIEPGALPLGVTVLVRAVFFSPIILFGLLFLCGLLGSLFGILG